jgi:hypothetical protein
MGDSGEGLVDAEARIQERMDELARERATANVRAKGDPVAIMKVEALRLTRVDLQRQVNATEHAGLKTARIEALASLDRKLAEVQAALVET